MLPVILVQAIYLSKYSDKMFENVKVKADYQGVEFTRIFNIKVKNANRIGEFSMTDGRMSKITKFMAETLFDENVGGEQGNMHMAIGDSFQECYRYNTKKMKKESLKKFGFNSSVIHTDIVATSKRKITATLKNGTKRVIYENGKFLL